MQLTTTATNRQGFAPATITEAIQFSEMLASSSMVPKAYQGKPQDIMVCVQWGYEIGLAPMQALQNIAVINGKPSVYGDAALALVQASAVCEDVEERFEGEEGSGKFAAVCVAKRRGRQPVVVRFSVEDAKRAGLWGKPGPWQAYPKRMLQMRARGFALRDAFPDVLKGLITAEEAQDFPDDAKPRPPKDITPRKPANPLDVIAAPEPPLELEAPSVTEEEIMGVELPVVEMEFSTQENYPDPQVSDPEPVDIDGEPIDPPAPGFFLRAPGQEDPLAVLANVEEWQDAYEQMADKIARSRKLPPRERMTKLREFREANQMMMNSLDSTTRLRHTAAHGQRLAALGAAQSQ